MMKIRADWIVNFMIFKEGRSFPPIPALAVVLGFLPGYCQEQVTQENAMAKSSFTVWKDFKVRA
jgi:hypothetical protein